VAAELFVQRGPQAPRAGRDGAPDLGRGPG
jgi:hypothetical protein